MSSVVSQVKVGPPVRRVVSNAIALSAFVMPSLDSGVLEAHEPEAHRHSDSGNRSETDCRRGCSPGAVAFAATLAALGFGSYLEGERRWRKAQRDG